MIVNKNPISLTKHQQTDLKYNTYSYDDNSVIKRISTGHLGIMRPFELWFITTTTTTVAL